MWTLGILIFILIISSILNTDLPEVEEFNNGICKKCGSKLRQLAFEYDEGRWYTCDNCDSPKILVTNDNTDRLYKPE